MKEIGDKQKRENVPCSWKGTVNIVKTSINIQYIPVKNPRTIFTKLGKKLNLKVDNEKENIPIAETIK